MWETITSEKVIRFLDFVMEDKGSGKEGTGQKMMSGDFIIEKSSWLLYLTQEKPPELYILV